jgi:pimeloyl-ACP methyl ester carboxylesterase
VARLVHVATEADLELSDGRILHYYDTREDEHDSRAAVFWQHGGGPHALACGALPGPGERRWRPICRRPSSTRRLFTPGSSRRWKAAGRGSAKSSARAMEQGDAGMVDDLLAGAAWGFAPAGITVPFLILHGAADRMVPSARGEWLAAQCPAAELQIVPAAGPITVLDSAPAALAWLGDRVRP